MRVAHLLHVGDQPRGELAIGQPAPALFGNARPRPEVHFIDRHRPLEPGAARPPRRHPLRIVPFVVAAGDDRRRQRRQFETEPVRIGLEQQLAVQRRSDLELVVLPRRHAGNEDLPDARRPEAPHRMHAAVPPVEVADDADALRVRRPDAEVRALCITDAHQVRAELVVDAGVLALREQVAVVLGDDAAVAIGIVDLDRMPVRIDDAQPVVEDLRRRAEERFEHAGGIPLHRRGLAGTDDVHPRGGRLVRADDDAVGAAMRPQNGEGVGMARARQRVEGLVDSHCHDYLSGVRQDGVNVRGDETGEIVGWTVEREDFLEARAADGEIPAVATLRSEDRELPLFETRPPPFDRRLYGRVHAFARSGVEQLWTEHAHGHHDTLRRSRRNLQGELLCDVSRFVHGSRVQRDAIFFPSSPGTHTTTTFAPAAPVLWRTLSGGFTKPDMPGVSIWLLPFTTCSSSPLTT